MCVRFLIDVYVTSKHEDVLDWSGRKQTEINTKVRRNEISFQSWGDLQINYSIHVIIYILTHYDYENISSYVSFFLTSQHLHNVGSYPIKLLLRKIKLNHGYLIFIVVEEIRNSGLSYAFSEGMIFRYRYFWLI